MSALGDGSAREDFPIFRQSRDRPLVYLDSAATAQKPQQVLDAMQRYFTADCSNVHRGVHALSERATAAYEAAREKVARFIGAASAREVVFLRGTTEAINLVAQTFGRARVGPLDEVLVTAMEHHSNIVPWQMLCEEKGARLRVAPMDGRGELLLEDFERLLTERTRLACVTHVSNALGTLNPVGRIVERAHRHGVPVLVDGAQAVPHLAVDVQALGCDFYAFSGHKLYGPTGIGVLYGKAELLEAMPPYQGGGDMISSVTFEKTVYNRLPFKFEAGTPNVAGAIGLGAAIDYLDGVGMEALGTHEQSLLAYATEAVSRLPGVRLIGTARRKAGVLSFVMEGAHPHDVGTILDSEGIMVRAGHHCAQPVMQFFKVPATVRASFGLYNTHKDVDALVRGLGRVRAVLGDV